jgi:hypothetical protein
MMIGIKNYRMAPVVFMILLFSAPFVQVLSLETPAEQLVNHFARVDSLFALSAGSVVQARFDSGYVYSAFRDVLHLNPELYALIVVDKKGKTAVAVCFEQLGAAFRDSVSHYEWFRKARKSKSAVFGRFVKFNGHVCLVWCRPCLCKNAMGLTTCCGAVIALVNVAECLKSFSAEFGRPFELARGDHILYHSDDWRSDAAYDESRFELAEGLGFTLRCAAATVPAGTLHKNAPSVMPSLPAIAGSVGPIEYHDSSASGGGVVLLLVVLAAGAALVALSPARKRLYRIVQRFGEFLRAGPNGAFIATWHENRVSARRHVMEELRVEIRSRIEKYEIAAIENDTREKLRRELRNRIRREMTGDELESLQRKVYEEEIDTLRSSIRQSVESTEHDALAQEARASVRAKIEEEVRRKESALLRREVRKEIEVKGVLPIEAIVEEQPAQTHLTVSTSSLGNDPIQSAPPVASEAVESLVRTVNALQKQRRGSSLFKLDETQTGLMIDYLEKISQRLNNATMYGHEPCPELHAQKPGDLSAVFQHPVSHASDSIPPAASDQEYSAPGLDIRIGTDV